MRGRISLRTQYTTLFGGFVPDTYLAYAVRGFFDNGGRQAYVVAVGADDAQNSNGDRPAIAAAAIPARLPSLGTSLRSRRPTLVPPARASRSKSARPAGTAPRKISSS